MVVLRAVRALLAIFVLCASLNPVLAFPDAEVVRLKSGSIDLDRHLGFGLGGQLNLIIDDVNVTGTVYNFNVSPDCNHFGAICLRGAEIRLPAYHPTEDGFNVGSATIGSVTTTPVYFGGGFNFDSAPITIPRASAVSGTIVITASFSATGTLLGCISPMPSGFCSAADTLFDRSFVGSGTATYRLRAIKGRDITGQNARYMYDLTGVSLRFND